MNCFSFGQIYVFRWFMDLTNIDCAPSQQSQTRKAKFKLPLSWGHIKLEIGGNSESTKVGCGRGSIKRDMSDSSESVSDSISDLLSDVLKNL